MAAARNLLCVAGALLVTGCLGGVPESNPDGAETEARAGLAAFFARTGQTEGTRGTPLSKVSLVGGDVVVAAPDGYCIDPATRRNGPERGFAVIASCHILSGGKYGRSVSPMLVTVTVGPRGDISDLPTVQALGDAAGAPLLDGKASADRVTAHLASDGDSMFEGSDPRYWRAVFVEGNRLIGLALYAPRGSALAGTEGSQMLSRIQSKISGTSAPAAPRSPTAAPAKKSAGDLLGRLFNRQGLPE